MRLYNYANWYRGNLHLHTTCSDGRYTPAQAIALYREAGYHFIAVTDHRIASDTIESPDFVQLSGVEWDTLGGGEAFHIVGVGMSRHDGTPHTTAQGFINHIRQQGGRAILAHPAWSLMQPDSIAALRGLTAAEVFNSVSRPPWNGERADSATLLDIAAGRGTPLPMVATDDVHFYDGDQFGGWIWVNAPALTCQNILQALDQGSFYASQGPRFEQIIIADERVYVTCSSVAYACFYSDRFYAHNRTQQGSRYFEYPIHPQDRYLRIEIVDGQHKKAWSNYLPLRNQEETL